MTTAIKVSISSTSTTTSYTQEDLRVFFFFPELLLGCGLLRISLSFSYLLMSCSYFCLVFHLDIFLTLPLKFSTVFCTYMSSFIISQSFFTLEYSFSCMNTACSLQWELNLLLFPSLLLFPLHFLSVCVCVFNFCFCLGLHLPCWEVFSSVWGSSALNLFSRANHENAPLMTHVKGDGRQQCRLRSLRIIFCRETQT